MINKGLTCLKKENMLDWKLWKKNKAAIYDLDFESILVPEDNGKQNLDDSYTNKYKKHVAYSYGYKLVCVNDKFSKNFRPYLGEDAVYSFINSEKNVNTGFKCWKNILTKNIWWLK